MPGRVQIPNFKNFYIGLLFKPETEIMLVELVKSESQGFGPDSTDMALALSKSTFYYRTLTDISENFDWYRIPFNRISAFALPAEHLAKIDLQELMDWSSSFRELIRWDQTRTPEGWTAYSDHEKLQFLAAWFKKILTDLTVNLIKSRLERLLCIESWPRGD